MIKDMFRRLTILIIITFSSYIVSGQEFKNRVTKEACECLDSILTYKDLADSIQPCIVKSMTLAMVDSTIEDKSIINTVTGIRGFFQEVNDYLISNCDNVKHLVLEEKKAHNYKLSDIELANKHYDNGNIFMEQSDYKNAIKEFKAAIKLDDSFVFAFDNLAISYRNMDNFKMAVKYYEKSLNIYPEGEVALLNIAVALTFLKEDKSALEYYENLRFLYPDSPEGYFGAAKILYLMSDFENALDNLFIAHIIYIESESLYAMDTEKLMNIIYYDMKDRNMQALFKEKADMYNIQFDGL